ncbi:hypothetical protein EGT50_06215 [Rhodococcus xishaensis]|uniref:Glycine zipper family protein n=2 Tax=Rhodococcus xishaensis TaxID=2487364 RepID=A0A3S3ABG3_9NOCA|nr:hypothetical protein [Rhodococcus xishaensis]RVW04077.1 hypothetical protein EGT50_06215 [Rhodococcus xishaensis]
MKLFRSLTLSVLVACAVVVGAATAHAEPTPQGADPAPQGIDWSQPLLTPTPDGNSQAAEQLFPGNDAKQDAFDNMTTEINIGWNNGGLPAVLIGSNVGMIVGCLSIFPNIFAGCILGTAIGTIAGVVIGIDEGNPNARPAVEEFFATP